MRKVAAVFSLAAVLMLSSATGAMAISIVTDTSWSWACNDICIGGAATSSPASVAVPQWAIPTTGTWISSVANNSVLPDTVVTFSKDIDFGAGSLLTLNVWADDTAGVFIDGVALALVGGGSAPNFDIVGDGVCADGKVGCEQDEFGSFSEFRSGVHTLSIQVHQLFQDGATPFGTLAEGSLDLAAVPEPATILLLGSALAAAGVASRRRLAKKSEAASSEAAS